MKKILIALALLMPAIGLAQTPGDVTFGASVTNANGSLSTTLSWSTSPAATSCTASGHASWTGTKAASGSLALPVITLSGTYPLTLNCTWPGDTRATLSWTAPTTNTDGSALAKCATATTTGACLASYHVYRRLGSSDLSTGAEMTPVLDPNAVQFVKTSLGTGTHYFGVEAVNGNGVPSVMSNVASKVISSTGGTKSAAVTLTVNPKPGTTVVTVE